MDVSIAQLSQRGGRSNNEDRCGHSKTEEAVLLVLADGMGGHPDGEVAADIAVRTSIDMFQQMATPVVLDPTEFLTMALRSAHYKIIRHSVGSNHKDNLDIPRTTAVACVVQQNKIWWAHCGDSRLYLVRDGKIEFCTVDHSYAKGGHNLKESLDSLNISRSMLYTCLGSNSLPKIQVSGPFELNLGDRVMLCSDGLWSAINDSQIAELLSLSSSISLATSFLVETALQAAGKSSDNVTVIGLEWGAEERRKFLQNQSAVSIDKMDKNALPLTKNVKFDDAIDQSIDEINELLNRFLD